MIKWPNMAFVHAIYGYPLCHLRVVAMLSVSNYKCCQHVSLLFCCSEFVVISSSSSCQTASLESTSYNHGTFFSQIIPHNGNVISAFSPGVQCFLVHLCLSGSFFVFYSSYSKWQDLCKYNNYLDFTLSTQMTSLCFGDTLAYSLGTDDEHFGINLGVIH